MRFAHDTEPALKAAVELVDTDSEPDTMTTLTQLRAFLRTHGYPRAGAADRSDLDAVRAIRPTLRALLTAERDDAAVMVNEVLARSATAPQLVRHADVDWHIHAVPDDRPLAERIQVETAMALIDLIRADEMSRLSVCAGADCDGIVLDLTRNRSKVFCSPACGNAAAVAAYRARRRG